MTDQARDNLQNSTPLESWKEIAAYIRRDVRTAKRWEKSEGLPVHRHQHLSRSSVYAYPSELEAWRANRKPSTEAPRPLWRQPLPSAALAGVMLLSLLMASSEPYRGQVLAAGRPEITIRRVWDGPDVDGMGDPSPDGRYLTFVDWAGGGHLALRDLETGETRILARAAGTHNQFALSSVWSPDGQQVAYGFFGKQAFEEIRVVGLDGGESRVVYSNPDDPAWPVAWFPDGESVLAISKTKDQRWGIARVSIADGSAHVLKRFDWPQIRLGCVSFSPDSNYIAYDFPVARESSQRDIYYLAADGSTEGVLVAHPANDQLLGWSPDGRILFLSDRTGDHDIWTLEIEDGGAVGQPKLLKRDSGIIKPVGFTTSGAFFYLRETAMHDVYVAEVDLTAGRLLSSPVRATESFLGATAYPAWSSDGRQLTYIVRRLDDRIRIRTLRTGEERELALPFRRIASPRWSPDGRLLLVCGQKDKVEHGCYFVEVATGECSTIFEARNEHETFSTYAWSPDGKGIFYSSRSRNPNWHGSIVRRDLETGGEEVLYSLSTFHNPIPLAVSPDGRQLALATSIREDDRYLPHTVVVIPTDGGEAREVARVGSPPWITAGALAWTPDGRYVVYGTDSGAEGVQFWRVSSTGGESERLFALDMNLARYFQLHPDGRQLTFMATQRGAEVWVMENFLPAGEAAGALAKAR